MSPLDRRGISVSTRLITVVCAILALAYAAVFVKKAHGPEGLVLDAAGRPTLTDYLSLWSAGSLAAEWRAAAAYDWTAHAARMGDAMGHPPQSQLQFSYPPSALLAFAPLSRLPFAPSFILFGVLTLIPFAYLAGRIVGRPEAALWVLATVPPFWNFAVGQTGALAATLLAAGLLLLPARPLLAGVMFGLLTVKPHLGLLVPVALLASRRWPTIAAAVATALALAVLSAIVHGLEPWLAFLVSLSKFGVFAMADTNATAYKMQSLFGLLRTLGAPGQIALAAQSALALAIAAFTWHIWRTPGAHDLKSAVLLATAVLVTPYAFHYDLTMLTLAQAFLLRHALATPTGPSHEVPRGPLMMILVVNALVMSFPPLSFPTGFLASLVLLAALAHRLAVVEPSLLPRLSPKSPATAAAA
jgi:hypothetical protein